MIFLGTVEKIFSYGKCGFITSGPGEHYYFSPKSFSGKTRRLVEGEIVMFTASEANGKPFAAEIEVDALRGMKEAVQWEQEQREIRTGKGSVAK